MTKPQTEAELEAVLLSRLDNLGYDRVAIPNERALLANLKCQLEKHNKVQLSESEFDKVLNHLDKGNVFDRAKTLRDKYQLTRDDGSSLYLQFLEMEHWCQNEYQVTQQVAVEGSYKNRYDITLLINGLPLVQIELKRRGLELKEAFNQINRYQRHSFAAVRGLFQYVQLFVISNGVNTKYYANNRDQSFKQTFYWAAKDNNLITGLEPFADAFLEKCHVSKMICKYIVLQETHKILMVLRPYQYYAVEAIAEQVKTSTKNGYIWHTTGSGKTLTSFKTAQLLNALPNVEKVVFVVDRADLDYQTTREFNAFRPDSVDGTTSTTSLVKQFGDKDTHLIVTTIQKLNTAISNPRHTETMAALADKRVVFIFDECHRSQFGETHQRITGFFKNAQLFGFTGTPIFADNAVGNRTTKDLFGECLHKYVITNAIKDENVLKFSVEYWGKLKRKDGSLLDDEKVAGLDIKEFFDNPDRINIIVDWIIAHHSRKTHNKAFSAILAVSSVDALIAYYEAFKAKQHDLRIATIFSYGTNEEDKDANGLISDPNFNIATDAPQYQHSRDKLNSFIADYNALYGTAHSAKDSVGFYNYYKDIGKRIKDRELKNFDEHNRVDILLVVNMYLTGFDAKKVNTLYVDKNLKYHGLIQAFSRTNRILDEVKSQGNIVCFRNLKDKTDEAITLFSNPEAREEILLEPYEEYVAKFNDGVTGLLAIAPTVDSVSTLASEAEEAAFVKQFRTLMRLANVLKSFSEFTFADLGLDEQTFDDYKSKYLDIYEKTQKSSGEEKASIISDLDFELELIQQDEINVAYILNLLAGLKDKENSSDENVRNDAQQQRKTIMDLLGSQAQLRSKKELIEKFINEHLPAIATGDKVQEKFSTYWKEEQTKAFDALCSSENLIASEVSKIIAEYNFSGRPPLSDTVYNSLMEKPKILQRRKIIDRVTEKILSFVKTFEDNSGDI